MSGQGLQFLYEALWLVLVLSGPPIVAAAVVGLLIAVFQSATQLQEQTLQYAGKFIAIAITLVLMSALVGNLLFAFANRIFAAFPTLAGR